MFALFHLLSIAGLACWVIEVVFAFKKEQSPLLGILSIIPCCALGGLIIGWINVKKWNVMPLMLTWTAVAVIQMILSTVFQQQILQHNLELFKSLQQ